MFLVYIFVVLLSISANVHAVGLHGFTFHGLEEPDIFSVNETQRIIEGWITQPLDHFNHRDNRTWSMRYYENAAFLNKASPILITVGGEWAISTGFLKSGLMYELASTYGGMMYYTEHRYYGESKPTKDTSSENMQYLNVEQALADLAYFIENKKKETGLENSPVILFGGSYAGNVVAWARLKYPHLVQGALASSAPIYAKADFYEYYEVVTKSLARHNPQCATDIKAAFTAVEELLGSKNGPDELKKYFNLCDIPDVHSSSDVGNFMNTLAEKFAGVVQYDKAEDDRTKIAACCANMTLTRLGSPLQRLARYIAPKEKCLKTNYNHLLKTYRNVTWSTNMMRQWLYQTCTEYGYYQTTNSKQSIFGTLFPLEFFTKVCTDLYGDYYNRQLLDSKIKRTNIMYGGRKPDLTNVIFTNGDIDPWHALSVLEDLNESAPAILINGSSHCRDLYSDAPNDVEDLKRARAKVRKIIGTWLSKV